VSSSLTELQAKIAEFQKQLVESASGVLKEEFAGLFEEFPDLESIGWVQYTPGFCDGDPCYFTALVDDADYIYINGNRNYDLDESVVGD
jgi:hypothetical protein